MNDALTFLLAKFKRGLTQMKAIHSNKVALSSGEVHFELEVCPDIEPYCPADRFYLHLPRLLLKLRLPLPGARVEESLRLQENHNFHEMKQGIEFGRPVPMQRSKPEIPGRGNEA